MKKPSAVLLTVLLVLVASSNAQRVAAQSNATWDKAYGGIDGDGASSVVQTSDGGYAIAGYTASFSFSSLDFWLVKTDASGNALWNRTYGRIHLDRAESLVQTSDGGYAIAGITETLDASDYDYWLVKTDPDGNELWNKTYGGIGNDFAHSLVQTADGGYAIAGAADTDSSVRGSDRFWLVRTDANGNPLWNKTYGETWAYAYSVVQASDGGFAIAGFTSLSADNEDFLLVKTDANGNMLWNKTYGGIQDDDAFSMVQTYDGGYALAGYSSDDFWLVKTDSSGNALWNKTYGGTLDDHAYSVVQTFDGGYAIAGHTRSFGAGGYEFWLVKTDANGNSLWNKTYGGIGDDRAYSVVQTSDGGYALAGQTTSYGAGNTDFWLVKTDISGIPEFPASLLITIVPLFAATLFFRKKLLKPRK